MRNPCGSVKDRLGVALIEDAERRGILRPGMTIVEATGGNTGIVLAFAATIRGYRLVLAMPESMSAERVALLRHLGAEVVLTAGILMGNAVARAAQLVREIPDALALDQFRNPAKPGIHRRTTAEEVWSDTGGAVDVFVSAVGTGGTITGVGEVLKGRKPAVRVVAVEPAGAAVLSGGSARSHRMPGIGVGFIPDVLNQGILDEVIAATHDEAFTCARRLAREEGIVAGFCPARRYTRHWPWPPAERPPERWSWSSWPTRASGIWRRNCLLGRSPCEPHTASPGRNTSFGRSFQWTDS
jgi:cysteine synthase A